MERQKSIMVSIICNTYNHEKYIAQALESFIKQKTTFAFEVLIHDDASTDGTASIIRSYEMKYPDVIKPIYQTENQYSKDVCITSAIQIPRATGKYIALCEGDDFWISEHKLQKQIECLERYPEASWCVCNAVSVNRQNERIADYNVAECTGEIPIECVIRGGGSFCATSSIIGRTEYVKNEPQFLKDFHLDIFLQGYLASCGKTMCIAETLTAYRRQTEGSWSVRMQENKDAYLHHKYCVIDSYRKFDEYTQGKYRELIYAEIDDVLFSAYRQTRDYSKLKEPRFKRIFKRFSGKEKMKFLVEKYCPWALQLLWSITRK